MNSLMYSPVFIAALLLLYNINTAAAGSACHYSDEKCRHDIKTRSSCGHWEDEGGCPSGYPVSDGDTSYCWSLMVHVWCWACAEGYRDVGNECIFCLAGKSSTYGQTSCTDCGLGTYSGNGEMCTKCPSGKYSDQPGQPFACKDCATQKGGGSVHWFSDVETMNMHDCSHCPSGQIVNEAGDGCEACTDGKYVEAINPKCWPCSPGKSSGSAVGMPDHSTCSDCPAGKFSSAGGVCEDCTAGKYSKSGQELDCIPCSPGEYSSGTTADYDATVCQHCPAGKKSNEGNSEFGSTHCVYCNAGKYSGIKSSACTFCDPGKTSNGTDLTTGEYVSVGEHKPNDANVGGPVSCFKCGAGKYTNAQKKNLCVNCDAGSYSVVGATVCTLCQVSDTYGPGHVSDAGSPDCSPCPAGTKSEDNVCRNCTKGEYSTEGSEECLKCKPGTYYPRNGTSVCWDCPVNTYQEKGKTSGGGDVLCSACPLGTWSDPAATSDGGTDGSCWPCGAGQRVKNNRCQDCDAGRYSNAPAGWADFVVDGVTIAAAERDYGNGCADFGACGLTGNYQCSYCDPGSDTNMQTGVTSCTVCSQGKYKYEPNEICEWCPAGKAAGGPDGDFKMSEASFCLSCVPGKKSGPGPDGHTEQSGATSCAACPNGRYSNVERAADCTVCDEGKYALSESGNGAIACSLCQTGRYNNAVEQSVCSDCGTGKYQTSYGATDCDDCTAGKYTDTEGNTFCTYCNQPTGSTSGSISAPGATSCTKCPPGSFSGIEPGVTFCQSCEGGKYTVEEGKRSCDSCEEGKYAPDPNADADLPPDFTSYPTVSPTKAPTTSTPTLPGTTAAPAAATNAPTSAPTATATSSPTMGPTAWSLEPQPNGAAQCTLCGVGKFSRDGKSQCDLCPPGRWTPASDETPGGEGTAASSLNYLKASCTECEVGKYSSISRASCTPCENPDLANQVYTSWAEVGSDTCYYLHTAEAFYECPKSTGMKRAFDPTTMTYEDTDKESHCRWYFIDDFTGQDFSASIEGLNANEGDPSPFIDGVADSCGNYTICKSDPTDDDEDRYTIACQDCAEGYVSAGTHTFGTNNGACSEKTVQRYCYRPTQLDLCPPDTTCQYWYKGSDETNSKDGDEENGGNVSPFFDPDVETSPDDPYPATACESYKVCGFDVKTSTESSKPNGNYLNVVCEQCQQGFISVTGEEKTFDANDDSEYGESSTCPGSYPTTCMNVASDFHTCPKCQLGETGAGCQRRLREWAEEQLEVSKALAILDAQKKTLRGSHDDAERELGFDFGDACTTCSCTGTNILSPCSLSDNCESSKSSCQSNYCTCKSAIPDVPDPDDINTDPGEYTVQCKYLYSTWKGEDLDEDDPELWDTEWDSKGAGIKSPFNNVENKDDPCEYYKLCQFETKYGGNLDEYHIACGKCRESDDYYMAIDFEESQVKDDEGWMCDNVNPGATHCYHWPKSAYEQHFIANDHDCNSITFNPKQTNKCHYWKGADANGGDFVQSSGGSAKGGPFGISCGSYKVCAFDAANGEIDNYYLQCNSCAAGYAMVSKDTTNTTAKDKGCVGPGFLQPGYIITECVKATDAPSVAPTDRPTGPVTDAPTPTATDAPSAAGGGGVEEKLTDPVMLGGVGGGALLLILLVAYMMKAKKQGKQGGRDIYDQRDTEGSGFEMSNPMGEKSEKKEKKEKKGKKGKKGKKEKKEKQKRTSKKDRRGEKEEKDDSKDWVPKKDPNTGQTFFYNRKTKAVSWTPPNAKGGAAPPPPPPPAPPKPASPVLKKVWSKHRDESSGYDYFIHSENGESRWEQPKNFPYED
ncbi:hypothetical protein TL16_g05114 [Triparma laevis f. inornata]|uniref:WW domain-containing protein n=1 Tax=Triparma laevis f. inornata TaxID=1714386 RepID=A0A9W7AH19_9STRA|nr:hypothetical protein TL16_g05114 [Triparma laevis f. inornata]